MIRECSEIVYAYTRAQALEDGDQVDVSESAREAGILFPVYMTRAAWARFVEVPAGVTGQDEAGRLWDVVYMLRLAMRRATPGLDRITVALYLRTGPGKARLATLKAECGPVDLRDPRPAITLLLPGED